MGKATDEALDNLVKTKQAMIEDLTPILGEKNATECAEQLLAAAIRAAVKASGIVRH